MYFKWATNFCVPFRGDTQQGIVDSLRIILSGKYPKGGSVDKSINLIEFSLKKI